MSRTNFDRVLRTTLDQAFSVRALLVLGYAALVVLLLRGLGVPERARPGLSTEIAAVTAGQLPDTTPVLLFVFNPADCPNCLELGLRFNAFYRSGDAQVLGVVVNGPADDVGRDSLGRALGFRFPMDPVPRPTLLDELVRAGHDTTPIVLLADTRRRVSLIVPPLRDPVTHTGAIRLLGQQLRHLREIRTKRPARDRAPGRQAPHPAHIATSLRRFP